VRLRGSGPPSHLLTPASLVHRLIDAAGSPMLELGETFGELEFDWATGLLALRARHARDGSVSFEQTCLSIYLYIYLSICLSIYPSISISISIYIIPHYLVSIYLSFYLSMYLSVYPSISIYIYISFLTASRAGTSSTSQAGSVSKALPPDSTHPTSFLCHYTCLFLSP